jgi:hypothetical protein
MQPQQPGWPPPYPSYRDPHDYYVAGQDDRPAYLHEPKRENPQAISGFAFGMSALGLFVLSGGISFLVSIPLSIAAMVVARRGMSAVDNGVATEHRRYAKAGFVSGIVTCALATLMGASLILAAIFPDEFETGDEFTALPLVRALVGLVRFATGS